MGRILVLDNMADAAQLVKRVLETAGHEVVAFTEEDKAIRYIESQAVDLAILDPGSGRGNGLAAVVTLRNLLPEMPIMILTGAPTVETARKANELGISDYRTKPMDNEELLDTVTSLL